MGKFDPRVKGILRKGKREEERLGSSENAGSWMVPGLSQLTVRSVFSVAVTQTCGGTDSRAAHSSGHTRTIDCLLSMCLAVGRRR